MLGNGMDSAHNDCGDYRNANADDAGHIHADTPCAGQITAAAGDDNAAQCNGRTQRQVDLTGNNHHGHAEGNNALQRLVAENVHDIVHGQEVITYQTHDNYQSNQQDLNNMIQQQILYFVLIHSCSSPILSAYN